MNGAGRSTRTRRRLAGQVFGMLCLVGLLLPAPTIASAEPIPDPGPCTSPGAPHGCVPSLLGRVQEELEVELMLPNLVPRPPTEVLVLGRNLRHTTVVANDGAHALDVLGEPTADPERWTASQCVSWWERTCTARRPTGELLWHPAHGHWHLEAFAGYELRHLDGAGQPDWSASGLIASSPKVSFCLMDSQRESGEASSFYVTCTGALQGISAGWADVYGLGLAGQSLPLAGVPDGRYALVVTVDPDDMLLESDETDNTVFSIVELSVGATKATVVSGP